MKSSDTVHQEQQHPQHRRDRQITDSLLRDDPSDYNLAELARLKVRYQGFPGSRDIQADLEKILKKWQLTEADLFQKTQDIYARGQIYVLHSNKREDWN